MYISGSVVLLSKFCQVIFSSEYSLKESLYGSSRRQFPDILCIRRSRNVCMQTKKQQPHWTYIHVYRRMCVCACDQACALETQQSTFRLPILEDSSLILGLMAGYTARFRGIPQCLHMTAGIGCWTRQLPFLSVLFLIRNSQLIGHSKRYSHYTLCHCNEEHYCNYRDVLCSRYHRQFMKRLCPLTCSQQPPSGPYTCKKKSVYFLKHISISTLFSHLRLSIIVVARSKVWTVFARSNTGIVGSNRTRSMDICYAFILFMLFRV
jgi:hypothetical protein